MQKTFVNDGKVPSLPVPNLEKSMEKMLKSLKAIAMNEEEYLQVEADVKLFLSSTNNNSNSEGGEGYKLYEEIVKKANAPGMKNWLEDWWIKYAYCIWRDPLPVGSSFEIALELPAGGRGNLPSQFVQAARQMKGMLLYKQLIDEEQIPPQYIRGNTPLCMNQIRCLFTTNRLPGKECDTILPIAKPGDFVIVIVNNLYYKMPLTLSQTTKSIEANLAAIVEDSKKQSKPKHAIGIMTSGNRTNWAVVRESLQARSERNRANLEDFNNCLFTVSLDDATPQNRTELSWQTVTGDANLRWYDKVVQLIAYSNGRAGVVGEHTPAEAIEVINLGDFIAGRVRNLGPFDVDPADSSPSSTSPSPKFELLKWDIPAAGTNEALETAAKEWEILKNSYNWHTTHFPQYGSEFIIKNAKVAPDAYMQMAIQLAQYLVHGYCFPTYETGMTRKFHHGRTETIRSVSLESNAFVKSMCNPNVSQEERRNLFQIAVKAHLDYMKDAMDGNGIDRLLLGMRIVAAEKQITPKLFQNPLFARSLSYIISTSNISPCKFLMGGMGPITANGYGSYYAILPNMIKLNASTFTTGNANVTRYIAAFGEALESIADLFNNNNNATTKSKI